uniref:DUF862 domain-containing protein n=1 Tax=Globodera pallida TaxID=36090 RepID=A0A183CHT2_GLOPA
MYRMSQNSSELRTTEDERTTNDSDGGRSSTSSSCANLEEHNRIRLAVYNLHKQLRLYHVGVLVGGKEFHYGIKIGVFACEPKNSGRNFHVRHFNLFRWGIEFMRHVDIVLKKYPLYTEMGVEQLLEVMEELRPRYKWADYNLLNHNCMDFAMEFIRRISAVDLPQGKFFSWTQEIRQPLILVPIRKICETEAWKRTVKVVREKQRKAIEKAQRGGGQQQTEERAESTDKIAAGATDFAGDKCSVEQQHILHRGALGMYITTIKILPVDEADYDKMDKAK